mgnify:CR=1 FL=1
MVTKNKNIICQYCQSGIQGETYTLNSYSTIKSFMNHIIKFHPEHYGNRIIGKIQSEIKNGSNSEQHSYHIDSDTGRLIKWTQVEHRNLKNRYTEDIPNWSKLRQEEQVRAIYLSILAKSDAEINDYQIDSKTGEVYWIKRTHLPYLPTHEHNKACNAAATALNIKHDMVVRILNADRLSEDSRHAFKTQRAVIFKRHNPDSKDANYERIRKVIDQIKDSGIPAFATLTPYGLQELTYYRGYQGYEGYGRISRNYLDHSPNSPYIKFCKTMYHSEKLEYINTTIKDKSIMTTEVEQTMATQQETMDVQPYSSGTVSENLEVIQRDYEALATGLTQLVTNLVELGQANEETSEMTVSSEVSRYQMIIHNTVLSCNNLLKQDPDTFGINLNRGIEDLQEVGVDGNVADTPRYVQLEQFIDDVLTAVSKGIFSLTHHVQVLQTAIKSQNTKDFAEFYTDRGFDINAKQGSSTQLQDFEEYTEHLIHQHQNSPTLGNTSGVKKGIKAVGELANMVGIGRDKGQISDRKTFIPPTFNTK